MTSPFVHQFFDSPDRVSQSLCNDRCQNILYKAVFEHFKELKWIAALLLASKSFQNSSFGANFLVNFVIDYVSIALVESILSPSSCFSLQFVPSLHISQAWGSSDKPNDSITNFVGKMISTKYLHLSLRSLTLDTVTNEVLSLVFGSSTCNAWPQLQDLSLKYCRLEDTVLETISKNAAQLGSMNLSASSGITVAGVEHISRLSRIISLVLTDCENITDAGIEHVSKLSCITSLDLSFCDKITDAGLEYISSCFDIATLDISGCALLTDDGLEHISMLSSITSLDLYECRGITDIGMGHVGKLSNITSLNICNCNVGDIGLEHISKLSYVTDLNLCNCNKITDVGLEFVSRLSRITILNLVRCDKISDAGLEHLVALSGIVSLNITCCTKISLEVKKKLRFALPNCKILG